MSETFERLGRLWETIDARRTTDPERSYVASLLAGGVEGAAKKVGEEAVETVLAAAAADRRALTHESADLLFHLLVLWAACGVAPAEVMAELARREGVSGHEEKRRRER